MSIAFRFEKDRAQNLLEDIAAGKPVSFPADLSGLLLLSGMCLKEMLEQQGKDFDVPGAQFESAEAKYDAASRCLHHGAFLVAASLRSLQSGKYDAKYTPIQDVVLSMRGEKPVHTWVAGGRKGN